MTVFDRLQGYTITGTATHFATRDSVLLWTQVPEEKVLVWRPWVYERVFVMHPATWADVLEVLYAGLGRGPEDLPPVRLVHDEAIEYRRVRPSNAALGELGSEAELTIDFEVLTEYDIREAMLDWEQRYG